MRYEDYEQMNRLHVTEPNADAAASCGDDDLSQKYKLERRKLSAQKTAGGQICTQLVMRC